MIFTSRPLAVIVLVIFLGGIVFSSATGWWATESTKAPVTFSEGEFTGQANPVDIRGSYTFGDIANSFDVTPEILAQAFGITEGDPADQEIYMPQSATDTLLARGILTPEQITYLEIYTVNVGESVPAEESFVESSPIPAEALSEEYTVKGKTTFGELITWEVPQGTLEQLIGAPMPDPAMILKDYASTNGLDFETLKPALQAEVDEVKP